MAFTPKTIGVELDIANLTKHNDNNAAIKAELDAHGARLSTMTDGAEPNQNAFASVNDIVATGESDALEIVGSTGITVSTSPTNKRVTITATGTAAPGAHGSTHGEGGADPIPELVALQADVGEIATQLAENAKHRNLIEGMEYLTYYFTKLRLTQPVKIMLSGDSTTANFGITDPRFYLETLVKNLLNSFGFFYATVINAGHNGAGTPQWIESYIAQDLAQKPDLYIPRWGVNDGSLPKETRVATFTTNLRNGLATIRASKSPEQMSIILMTPNSTNDHINGRDAEWYEQIIPIIRKAARDFQCCFVDTYNYMLDSTNVVWQDDMHKDGIHVHPLETANASIISLLDIPLIPPALRKTGVTNVNSADGTKLATDAPSTYPLGLSLHRSGSDAPYDGMFITKVQVNGVVYQENVGIYAQANEGIAVRRGLSVTGVPGSVGNDAWGKWIFIGSDAKYQNLSTGNGWINFGSPYATAQYLKDANGNIQIKGRIKGGTTTTGWMIAELPEGCRLSEDRVFVVTCNGVFGTVKINSLGQILTESISSNAYIDFGTIVFKAEK